MREEIVEQAQPQEVDGARQNESLPLSSVENRPPIGAVTPQQAVGSCPTCAAAAQANTSVAPAQANTSTASPQYVYAVGNVVFYYPSVSVEKELRQATARTGNAVVNLTDPQATATVLQDPQNMYIVRELCWVLQIQGIDTYILVPTDPSGYQLLLGALRPQPAPGGVDVVIGTRGPIATPAMCNGIIVPLLFFDQIYSSDRSTLVKSVPTPAGADPNTFETSANTTYDQLMAQSGTGDTDASKALAYLALRYPQIYASACTAIASNSSLTSVSVLPSNLSATRRIVDVVFAFTNRNTDVVSKQFVRVDVTGKYPFLVTKMAPYFSQ